MQSDECEVTGHSPNHWLLSVQSPPALVEHLAKEYRAGRTTLWRILGDSRLSRAWRYDLVADLVISFDTP